MTDLPNPSPHSATILELQAELWKIAWQRERFRLRFAQFIFVLGMIHVAFGVPLSAHLAWLLTHGAEDATETWRALPYSFVGIPFWMPFVGVALVAMSRTEIRRGRGNMAELARLDAMHSA